MTKHKKKLFNLLKTLALSGEKVANAQLAAAIVYKNEIIAFGQNQYKTHPFQSRFSKNENAIFLHAETCAIYNALKKLSLEEISKTTLYVLRIKSDKTTGTSKPCSGCMQCIATFGIKHVYYTEDNANGFTQYK